MSRVTNEDEESDFEDDLSEKGSKYNMDPFGPSEFFGKDDFWHLFDEEDWMGDSDSDCDKSYGSKKMEENRENALKKLKELRNRDDHGRATLSSPYLLCAFDVNTCRRT